MGQKVRWISFWVTLTYWLGSAWGCANTFVHDPIQTAMETPPHEEQAAQDDASQDGAQPIALLPESPQPEEERAQQETPQPERREAENTRAVIATPVSETARSVRTLDRSKWPRMVIGPADGATPHGPLLFEDVPVETETNQDDEPHYAELDLETVRLPAEDFSRVSENASVGQSQILEALGDGQAQNWSAQNGKHLLLQTPQGKP